MQYNYSYIICIYIYCIYICLLIIIYIYICVLYVCLFAHVPKPLAARYAAPQSSADHSIEILSQAGNVEPPRCFLASKQGKCQPLTCSLVGKMP